MAFADDLARLGPGSTARFDREAARAYCARLTREHYENFSVVNALLPRGLRPAFESVYAFCRWSDDLGDEVPDRQRARELLAWWRDELESTYQGGPSHPVMVALEETIREYEIPKAPFLALISAFEQDQDVLQYETDDQLRDYCSRSACPVGRLVLCLARANVPENFPESDAICTGLQLANFWQDVARDWAIGRVYLPRADRERHGVSLKDFEAGRATPGFRAVLAEKVEEARASLVMGRPLADRLAPPFDLSVDLFARGGLAILDKVAAQDFDVWTRRPALSKLEKGGLMLKALARRRLGRRVQVAP